MIRKGTADEWSEIKRNTLQGSINNLYLEDVFSNDVWVKEDTTCLIRAILVRFSQKRLRF